MLRLKIPVSPRDHLLFVSRLWHEVDIVSGIRGSLVSYTKRYGSLLDAGEQIHVPDDLRWILQPDFGLSNNTPL